MEEKILSKKQNGMPVLLGTIAGYIAAIALIILAIFLLDDETNPNPNYVLGGICLAVGLIWSLTGWILFLGLKVLKPQEALVLTLFGDYIGTLKGQRLRFHAQHEDLPESYDPVQLPAEDQRLPGQSRGDRHRRHVAGGGHRQGGIQCGQL